MRDLHPLTMGGSFVLTRCPLTRWLALERPLPSLLRSQSSGPSISAHGAGVQVTDVASNLLPSAHGVAPILTGCIGLRVGVWPLTHVYMTLYAHARV